MQYHYWWNNLEVRAWGLGLTKTQFRGKSSLDSAKNWLIGFQKI